MELPGRRPRGRTKRRFMDAVKGRRYREPVEMESSDLLWQPLKRDKPKENRRWLMLIVIISDFLCIYKSDVFVPDMPFHHEKLCLVVCCLCLSFLLSHAHVSHLCYLLPGLPSCVFKPFSVFPPVPWAPCKSVQPCLPCQGSNSAK